MNTPSHLLMTSAVRKVFPGWQIPLSAALLGSVAPDVPLTVVSLGAYAYFHYGLSWTPAETLEHMYGTLYFNDPGWMAAHNLLHAPLMVFTGLAACRIGYGKARLLSGWWTWFFMACLFHSVVDIFTHFDDGPLLLFPFEWSIRLYSPVSYWDASHYGRQFFVFEALLNCMLAVYLLGPALVRRMYRVAAEREGG